ncbi:phosphate ABC transporter substrate-binding protein PstS [Saccharomonospora sp. CUA-673]|uniref:phosphate ABC transporter substrate-binding protein PstS n=1 Tax=Saccharomonospora sp. CUA-673 TaxID=1904969 RepID=UPI00095ABC0A|nr:phosphate ABC transporter substrate-binding protein PstS [Saccharomonospora sp. CUA-673]OLT46347.1 phosphate ABC transporter substrate-binding protein PstS [Saccharomonospora sp. CUA-673]
MKRSTLGRALVLPTTAALAFGIAACGAANEEGGGGGTTINGAGASAQEAAQTAWRTGFLENNEGSINYDPVGSGGGREQFISGGTDFAGSDSYLDDEEVQAAQERCGEGGFVEIPAYISPIAVVFNVEGVNELNLKPATIAKIFNQEITNWNDPEIQADNPNANLPDTAISPVNRSDASGTTENFVEYLEAAAPEDWPHEVSDEWPVQGGEAAQGTAGVVQAVQNGNGSIGYADASQAGDLNSVNVGVGEEFVEYSPEAAASVVDVSERAEGDRGEHSFAFDLARDTTEAGTYPIVLVSYVIACAQYDDEGKANMVKDYLNYTISEEGQQAAQETAGSAPISDELRQQVQPAVDAIAPAGGGN